MASPTPSSVYSRQRLLAPLHVALPQACALDQPQTMNGLSLLKTLPPKQFALTIFDPQYRGVLDKLSYGNEGHRQMGRGQLKQMKCATITTFIQQINRVLMPSGHLFLWVDKYHLCTGIGAWLAETDLSIVDLVVWDKGRFGNGYRTRRQSEYLLIIQKAPLRAKGVWAIHNIPDVMQEPKATKTHPHAKPIALQARLIEAVTNPGDFVIDPAAGSYSVLTACQAIGRRFIGCDIEKQEIKPTLHTKTHLITSNTA